MKPIKEMSDKEIVEEINVVEKQISLTSFGIRDLMWREQLYRAVIHRNIDIEKTYKIRK